MAIFTGLAKFLVKKKRKYMNVLKAADCKTGCVDVQHDVIPIRLSCPSKDKSSLITSKSFPSMEESSSFITDIASMDSLVIAALGGNAAHDGSVDHDGTLPMKSKYSEFNLQAEGELVSHGSNTNLNNCVSEIKIETNENINYAAMVVDGFASYPTMDHTAFWASPYLKQSESTVTRSSSYRDLKILSRNDSGEFQYEDYNKPSSIKSSCSADCLILQKHSSCQALPSQSGNVWWNLCLWRDDKPHSPHRLALVHSTACEHIECSSDTHELIKEPDEKELEINNQWVSFSLQPSSHDRVYSWINSLEDYTFFPIDDEKTCSEKEDEVISGPHHIKTWESSCKNHLYINPRAAELVQANNIIQSLNSCSPVAHFSGIGLKAIPSISAFGSLRSVSLSQNLIVHIASGCLPKNIHTLDLSWNKLSTIEGLRDLTRLRILNLSHNRISRVGHGLASCTALKELYLAGNRISEVEGLHRLLKLTVLDLSFNKLTTARAFSQLVANYNSLFTLNLLGNPMQSNGGDDQIRKAVTSILPHIRYLNKKPIKQHRAREVAAHCVANAAVGSGGWNSRRRPTKRVGQGSGSSSKSKNWHQLKIKHHYSSVARK